MKALLACLALLAAPSALAQSTQLRTWQSTQAAAGGSAPSTFTDGVALAGVVSYKLSVCAVTGQTLSGAGDIIVWGYSYTTGLWATAPLLTLEVTSSGTRCYTSGDIEVVAPFGRVYFQTSSVTVSGGTNVVITFEGWTQR